MNQRQKHLDELSDWALASKFSDIQNCILTAKTEEQAERYNEQMIYAKNLIASRQQLVTNFTAMGKDRITTGHEGEE